MADNNTATSAQTAESVPTFTGKQFQYESSYRSTNDNLLELLQKHGKLGWEVILIERNTIYWKRELTPEVEALEAAERDRTAKMHAHLWHDHELRVYIGDVFEAHAEKFPGCPETSRRMDDSAQDS